MNPISLSTSRDGNGNRVLLVKSAGRAFSVQTNGNLPETHRNGVGPHTMGEIREYVANYGTARQKAMLAI